MAPIRWCWKAKPFDVWNQIKKTQNQAAKTQWKILLRKGVKNANLKALRDPWFCHFKVAPLDRTWVAPLGRSSTSSYQFSNRFKKDYKVLPQEIQNAFDKKLAIFLNNIYHPSLRVKKIQGTKNRWEGSITMKYRFTFEFFEDTLIFRTIGTHDILKKWVWGSVKSPTVSPAPANEPSKVSIGPHENFNRELKKYVKELKLLWLPLRKYMKKLSRILANVAPIATEVPGQVPCRLWRNFTFAVDDLSDAAGDWILQADKSPLRYDKLQVIQAKENTYSTISKLLDFNIRGQII